MTAAQSELIAGLRADHKRVRALIRRIEDAMSGARPGEPDAREMFRRLMEELEVHERIENEVLVPAARRAGGNLSRLAEETVLYGHEDLHRTLGRFRGFGMDHHEVEDFYASAGAFFRLLEEHMLLEEQRFFPAVEEHLED